MYRFVFHQVFAQNFSILGVLENSECEYVSPKELGKLHNTRLQKSSVHEPSESVHHGSKYIYILLSDDLTIFDHYLSPVE